MTFDGPLRVTCLLSAGRFEIDVGCSLNLSESGHHSHLEI